MNFHEAYNALTKGKSIRRKSWLASTSDVAKFEDEVRAHDVIADDWIVIEPPQRWRVAVSVGRAYAGTEVACWYLAGHGPFANELLARDPENARTFTSKRAAEVATCSAFGSRWYAFDCHVEPVK